MNVRVQGANVPPTYASRCFLKQQRSAKRKYFLEIIGAELSIFAKKNANFLRLIVHYSSKISAISPTNRPMLRVAVAIALLAFMTRMPRENEQFQKRCVFYFPVLVMWSIRENNAATLFPRALACTSWVSLLLEGMHSSTLPSGLTRSSS